MSNPLKPFSHRIERMEKHQLLRYETALSTPQTPTVQKSGKKLICMASNNYLNLTVHPEVKKAVEKAVKKYGSGAGAARLITGTMNIHKELEEEISRLKQTEDTVLFGSGYAANVGTLQALSGADTMIYWDELNHASIIDGIRMSNAESESYSHSSPSDLKQKLEQTPESVQKKLIVTDGVFSMDGDLAPLPELVELAHEHNAILMVDDAHGTGVLGEEGRGTLNHFGIDPEKVHVRMGTLSKALAAQGGFVSGRKSLITYLRNRARTFVYSTAPAPPTVAAARKAIQISRESSSKRNQLMKRVQQLHIALRSAGFQLTTETPRSAIVALLIGDVDRALQFSELLEQDGFLIPAIRPPTVPRGSSRLRISLMSAHTEEQVENVIVRIKNIGKSLDLI